MIRVQIKNNNLRFRAVIELLSLQYKITINNKNGDCLYVWNDGSKKCEISHWTNDNPIIEVDENNYIWFIKCLK